MAADPQAVLYRYQAKKNTRPAVLDAKEAEVRPAEAIAHIPGVPLRDLTKADMDSFPKWVRDAVKASDLYAPAEPEAKEAPAPKAKE